MIEANGVYISAEISEIIGELKTELELNGVKRFYKSVDAKNNFMTCCPFHKDGQERKPSFGILKKDGTCHCFSCGWVGSLSEMVSNCFGYDDLGIFGNKWLTKNFVSVQIEERKDVELDFVRSKPVSVYSAFDTELQGVGIGENSEHNTGYIREKELDKYRYYHPYMYERKLNDEVISKFDIGFDTVSDCITFPVRDTSGRCLFVARRSVRSKYFSYPEGVVKPLYGLYELNQEHNSYNMYVYDESIYICESMIDCLTVWVYGKYAVALNGLGNDLQFKQLREIPCREFILATDSDEAGMKARKRIAKNLPNKLLKQVIFPKGKKDINELGKDEFENLKITFA